jgi:LCP family protein required for cell wall assembly
MAENVDRIESVLPSAAPKRRRRAILITSLAVILLVAGGVAGVSWWRVHRAFEEVNSIAPLPSVVSAESLGVESTVEIDTGPAQAAIATAEAQRKQGGVLLLPTPTPNSAPAIATPAASPSGSPAAQVFSITQGSIVLDTSHPESAAQATTATATASPASSATPAPTRPAATPEASPVAATPAAGIAATPIAPLTATPVLSSIERLTDGDFESDSEPWYFEGAVITAGMAHGGANSLQFGPDGAYANQQFTVNTGTNYFASAWVIGSEPGQTLQIGVAYYDAAGNRRKDLEPDRPVYAVTTAYQQIAFTFTPPAEITLAQLTFNKVAAPGTVAIDDVSLRAILPEDLLAPPTTLLTDDAITILVMGVDARPGEPIDQGVRPDSLMVVRLNPDTGSCRVLAIPRDTRVDLPGYGQSKINHALAVGGIPYEQLVVEQYLGLAIDHYVLVDFTGFSELVDDVGGIDITVPDSFTASDGTLFQAGPQHMNGTQALSYSRFRGDSDGDFGRIKRQQQLIQALMAKASDISPVDAVTELVPSLGDRLRTDLGQNDMLSLAEQYGSSCTDDSVEFLNLDGAIATFDDPLLHMPLSYVVVDETELRRKVAELIGTS